jgi:hypothetical protein
VFLLLQCVTESALCSLKRFVSVQATPALRAPKGQQWCGVLVGGVPVTGRIRAESDTLFNNKERGGTSGHDKGCRAVVSGGVGAQCSETVVTTAAAVALEARLFEGLVALGASPSTVT